MIQTKIRKLKPSDHKYTAKDRINHNELTEKYSDIKTIEELHKQKQKIRNQKRRELHKAKSKINIRDPVLMHRRKLRNSKVKEVSKSCIKYKYKITCFLIQMLCRED